jgi:hypothetical protein
MPQINGDIKSTSLKTKQSDPAIAMGLDKRRKALVTRQCAGEADAAAALHALTASAEAKEASPSPARSMLPPPPQLPAAILALCEGPPSAWQQPGESDMRMRVNYTLDSVLWHTASAVSLRQGH